MNKSNWYPEFEKSLVQELKGTKERDLKFFRIEEFLRMAERVDAFSPSCRECATFKLDSEKQKDSIARAVHTPGRERREFDRLQSKMGVHMRKKHGFYPPYYFTYLHSATWTAGLMLAAYLLSQVIRTVEVWVFLTPAFAIGVITGQIVGGRKDRRVREENRIL